MIAAASDSGTWAGLAIWWLFLLVVYWVPTFVAWKRHVHGLGQVVVVNALLGWTGIGWIIALVMSFRHVPEARDGTA